MITAANKEKVRGLIPDEFYAYAIEGFPDLEMKIVAHRGLPGEPEVRRGHREVRLPGDRSTRTGKLTNYTAGQPFPFSEWAKEATGHKCDLTPDDPQFALKLAWDVNYRWQGGSGFNLPHWGFANMRNNGRETWRISQGEYRRTYFSARADLLPDDHRARARHERRVGRVLRREVALRPARHHVPPVPLPRRQGRRHLGVHPGAAPRAPHRGDPEERLAARHRVHARGLLHVLGLRVGPRLGVQGREQTLLAVSDSSPQVLPARVGRRSRRPTWCELLGDEEWRACRFDPYGAMPMVGESWQKRVSFELDDVPKQKGHPYSRKKIWYDKETMSPGLAVAYDRAGKPFKSCRRRRPLE